MVALLRTPLPPRLPGTKVVANQSSLFERGLAAGRAIDVQISGPQLEGLVQLGRRIMGSVSRQIVIKDAAGNVVEAAQAQPIPSLDLASPELHVIPRPIPSAEMMIRAVDLGYIVDALIDGAYVTAYFLGSDRIDLSIIGVVLVGGMHGNF